MTLKNVSTYQLRMRTTTWVCRVPAVEVGASGTSIYDSLSTMLTQGFTTPYTTSLSTGNSVEFDDISSTLFQNPIWVQHFKAIKVRNWTLMPYRSRVEKVHMLRRHGGYIWEYGSALDKAGVGSEGAWACVKGMGGITTVVKTIEVVGELVNNATMVTPPTISVGVFTSPGVLLLQQKIEFDSAIGGPVAAVYTAGDATPPAQTEALTGQPWNYMFPGPSSSSSVGTSTVIGALSSGI